MFFREEVLLKRVGLIHSITPTHIPVLVVVVPLQLLDEPVESILKIRIVFGHILNLLNSVKYGRMVSSPKMPADLRKGQVC